MDEPRFIPTRRSLLSRLKDWDNQDSWREFFNTYWRLVYDFGAQDRLDDGDAQDVVQETVLSGGEQKQGVKKDPPRGYFKGWLMQITHPRVRGRVRER